MVVRGAGALEAHLLEEVRLVAFRSGAVPLAARITKDVGPEAAVLATAQHPSIASKATAYLAAVSVWPVVEE